MINKKASVTIIIILLLGCLFYFVRNILINGPTPPGGRFPPYSYINKYICDGNKKITVEFQGAIPDPGKALLYLENTASPFKLVQSDSLSEFNLYGVSNNFKINAESRNPKKIEVLENGTTIYANCVSFESKAN